MAFKMKRGANPSFKNLGSSPIRQHPKFKSHAEANMPGHAGTGGIIQKPHPSGDPIPPTGIPQKGSPAQLGVVKTWLKKFGKKKGQEIAKRELKKKAKPKTNLKHKLNKDGSINKTTKAYKEEFKGLSTTLPETTVSPKTTLQQIGSWIGGPKKNIGRLLKGGAWYTAIDKAADIIGRWTRTGEWNWSDPDDVDPSGETIYYEGGDDTDSTKSKFSVPEE